MIDSPSLTLKRDIDEYLQWMLSAGYSFHTCDTYRNELNNFFLFIIREQIAWNDIFTLDNMGINQGKSLLNVMSILRERVWQLCDFQFYQIRINIDTTVKTVYGQQQGARKGHNTKHRGKEGLRPILCFIEETREYLLGKLRKGTTVDGKETAQFIDSIKQHLPGCVQNVLLRADGEFLSWESVKGSD